jgi:ribosomal protein L27
MDAVSLTGNHAASAGGAMALTARAVAEQDGLAMVLVERSTFERNSAGDDSQANGVGSSGSGGAIFLNGSITALLLGTHFHLSNATALGLDVSTSDVRCVSRSSRSQSRFMTGVPNNTVITSVPRYCKTEIR